MGESKPLATEGQAAYRVTAGQISRPLRLAKAGDTKKAPGPSCVLSHQVDFSKYVIAFPLPQFGMPSIRNHSWAGIFDIHAIQ